MVIWYYDSLVKSDFNIQIADGWSDWHIAQPSAVYIKNYGGFWNDRNRRTLCKRFVLPHLSATIVSQLTTSILNNDKF